MDTSELLKEMENMMGRVIGESPTNAEAMGAANISGGGWTSNNMKIVKNNAWANGYYCAVRDMKDILDRGERTRDYK